MTTWWKLLVLWMAILAKIQLSLTEENDQCYSYNETCIPLTTNLCLGATLSIKFTSLTFAADSNSLDDVYEKLRLWSGLQNAPQCWQVVQPFLCSVYLPKCDDETGNTELPSRELCERTREPCQIVKSFHDGSWPEFLRCDQPHFVSGCKTDTYEKLVFNTSAKCEYPLILTENKDSWFTDVPGCGIPCQNLLFTKEEHDEVHIFIGVFGSICLVCTLFTVLTFLIDWKNASRYPALILFYINACFFVGSIGWLAQFAGDARTDIVCRSDGTARQGEPQIGSGETASCTIVFLMVYYTMMAGVMWFVMLAYSWHLTFKALGTPKDSLSSKTAYFHLISWLLPLVLSIICLAMTEIDGDSLSGICFVGYMKHGVRAGFVLTPIAIVLVTGLFFLVSGLVTLIKIRKAAPIFLNARATSKLRETIYRLGTFSCLSLLFVLVTLSVHVYTFANEHLWRESFSQYYKCKANVTITQTNTTSDACHIENQPSIIAMEIHIFAFFGAGIVMSSWSWNRATLNSWERFLRMVFHKPSNKPVKLKKHKMIAQAFEKRKNINNSRMSISFHSTHDDPLGMKFDFSSAMSRDNSTNFQQAMPKLIRRRGGLIHPVAGPGRRYSDSDVPSIGSRRFSADSQLSQGPSLAELLVMVNEKKCEEKKKKQREKRRRRRQRAKMNRIQPDESSQTQNETEMHRFGKQRRQSTFYRRGSDTSVRSRMSANSVQFSIERRSIEALSLATEMPVKHSDIEDLEMAPETKVRLPHHQVPTPRYNMFTASKFLPDNQKGSKFSRHLQDLNDTLAEMRKEITNPNLFSSKNPSKKKNQHSKTKSFPNGTPSKMNGHGLVARESRLHVEPELESISD